MGKLNSILGIKATFWEEGRRRGGNQKLRQENVYEKKYPLHMQGKPLQVLYIFEAILYFFSVNPCNSHVYSYSTVAYSSESTD